MKLLRHWLTAFALALALAAGAAAGPKPAAGAPPRDALAAQAQAPRWLKQGLAAVGDWQRQAYRGLVRVLAADRGELLLAAALSVGLGAVHALTPGHGKTVLATYLLGREPAPWRSFWLALRTSSLHILSTVVMFLALYWAWVGSSGLRPGDAPQLRMISGAAIGGIGLWLLARALWHIVRDLQGRPRPPVQPDRAAGSRRSDWAISLAAGIVPCPLTTVLLLFTVQAGMIAASILVTLGMFIGVAATLGLVCMGAVLLRAPLTSWFRRYPRFNAIAGQAVGAASGAAIAGFGLIALWGQVLAD